MLEIDLKRGTPFCDGGSQIFSVHFIQEDRPVETHPAAGSADDSDDDRESQIPRIVPSPDGK